MNGWPKVAIIVLNGKSLADTCECTEAVGHVAYPNHETIIVDMGGTDIRALQQRFGHSVHVIENDGNSGFAAGTNTGIRYALDRGADYVLLLNNGTVVDPAFLSSMVQAAQELPQAAALCPRVCHYGLPRVLQSTGGWVNPWTGRAGQVDRDKPDDGRHYSVEERDYADGACMLISRSALERVGLLDEEYFAYRQEADWCARAAEAGYKCYYVPTARVWHKTASCQATDVESYYQFRRDVLLFLSKRKRTYHLATAILFHIFVLAPLHLLRNPAAWGRLIPEARALLWHVTNPSQRQQDPLLVTKEHPSGRRGT